MYAALFLIHHQQNELFTALEHSKFSKLIPKAIPVSDSAESKELRALALETLIAECLVESIFTSTFPCHDSGNGSIDTLEQVLKSLSQNPQREAVFRAILSKAELPNHREKAFRSVFDRVEDVCKPFLQLLGVSLLPSFHKDLKKMLDLAWEVWQDAQSSRSKIVATISKDHNPQSWIDRDRHVPVASSASNTSHVGTSGHMEAVLFPLVYSTHSPKSEPIYGGFGLYSDVDLHERGLQEYKVQFNHIAASSSRYTNRVSTLPRKDTTNNFQRGSASKRMSNTSQA
jgi:hypothetical protein